MNQSLKFVIECLSYGHNRQVLRRSTNPCPSDHEWGAHRTESACQDQLAERITCRSLQEQETCVSFPVVSTKDFKIRVKMLTHNGDPAKPESSNKLIQWFVEEIHLVKGIYVVYPI